MIYSGSMGSDVIGLAIEPPDPGFGSGMISKAPPTITSSALTTCAVINKGQGICLGFLDRAGDPVSIEFPFEQAHSIIMTLPHLLSLALKQQTLDPAARYVFSLNKWTLERMDDETVIVTMTTEGGFAVSFSVPLETCKAFGFALKHEGQSANEGQIWTNSPATVN